MDKYGEIDYGGTEVFRHLGESAKYTTLTVFHLNKSPQSQDLLAYNNTKLAPLNSGDCPIPGWSHINVSSAP